ncbi:MAG: flagellar hook-associated protein 3 [Pseudomonas sp.]|nr:MAG: flagellar hook-associated protein 3 [Pseudomonas sp.]
MRISTIQVFNSGVNGIQRNYADVTRTQEQINSGKKILTPSDDPVGAVRLMQLEKEQGVLDQYKGNLNAAKNSLTQQESALQSINNAMHRVRELALSAGNGALTQTERNAIAVELREREEELLGLMNSKNARGEYLFGGFQGKTQPYVQTADGTYSYAGDEGRRKVQIASSQELAITDSGKEIFDRVTNASRLVAVPLNLVPAAVTPPAPFPAPPAVPVPPLSMGAPLVVDEVAAADFPAQGVEIVFGPVDPLAPDAPRTYAIHAFPYVPGDPAIPTPDPIPLATGQMDTSAERSDNLTFRGVNVILDGVAVGGERFYIGNPASGSVSGGQVFVTDMDAFLSANPSGSLSTSIAAGAVADTFEVQLEPLPAAATSFSALPADYPLSVSAGGVTVLFQSPPAAGDALAVSSTGSQQSQGLLNSVVELRRLLENPSEPAVLRDSIASALSNFDNAMISVDSARGSVGARLNVIETTLTSNEDLAVLNKSIASSIQDLDYAEALSRLSFQSVILEAAQKSYVKISGLSLFNKI